MKDGSQRKCSHSNSTRNAFTRYLMYTAEENRVKTQRVIVSRSPETKVEQKSSREVSLIIVLSGNKGVHLSRRYPSILHCNLASPSSSLPLSFACTRVSSGHCGHGWTPQSKCQSAGRGYTGSPHQPPLLCCWPPRLPWSCSFDPHGRVLRKHNRTNAQGRNNITYVNGFHAQQRDIPSIPCSVLAVCEMTDCSRCCFMRHAATCKIYAQQNETVLVPRQPHKTHLCLRFRQTANTFVGVHSHCAVPQPLPLLLDGSGQT